VEALTRRPVESAPVAFDVEARRRRWRTVWQRTRLANTGRGWPTYDWSSGDYFPLASAVRVPLSRTAAANASHTDMNTRLVTTSLRW
jgi:hypothetical protein